jgi:hypothetical protein
MLDIGSVRNSIRTHGYGCVCIDFLGIIGYNTALADLEIWAVCSTDPEPEQHIC